MLSNVVFFFIYLFILFYFIFFFFFAAKHVVGLHWIASLKAILMNTHNLCCAKKKKKKKKKKNYKHITKYLLIYSCELLICRDDRQLYPNIQQNIIELSHGSLGKISADDILNFFFFFFFFFFS